MLHAQYRPAEEDDVAAVSALLRSGNVLVHEAVSASEPAFTCA